MKFNRFFTLFIVFIGFFTNINLISFAQSPQITQQPENLIKCLNNAGSISVVATGAEPLHYQWYKDGNPYGADNSVLDFPSLQESDEGEYYCSVTNGEGSTDSYVCTVVVVNGIPVINNITTENDLVCVGTDNLFTSDVSGENFYVTWFHYSDNVGYGTNYYLTSTEVENEGEYYFTATNVCGIVFSDTLEIDVVIPAYITTEPQTQTICEGEDVVFSPVAEGDYLFYIWMKDSVIMPTEQNLNLTVSGAIYPHLNYYNLIAYNVCAHDTSNTVYILVNNIPQITGNPLDHNACTTEEITLYASAGGTTEVEYQWYEFDDGIIDGETASSFIPDVISGDTSYYYCRMSNICGTVFSDTAEIIIKEAPIITQQPTSSVLCAGDNISIQIKASGTEVLYYQWLFNGADVNGVNIAGDESSTLIITGITEGQQGLYSCHVINDCGFVVTEEALLTVNTAPSIIEQPEDITICEGEELEINLNSTGTDPIDFEWFVLGNIQPVGSEEEFYVEISEPEQSGEYYCILSNTCGSISTDTVTILVKALPQITTHPEGGEVCVDDVVEMFITASGEEPLQYLWYRNGSAVSDQTNETLVYEHAQVNQSGTYFCRVMNDCGYEDSFSTELTVGSPAAITWNPVDQNLCEHDTLNLIMDAQGDNYTLQWYFNNSPIPGENDTVLNIINLNPSQAGLYYCSAYNSCAVVNTDTVSVVINEAPDINLGTDIDLCEGETTTLTAGDNYVHYNWNDGLSYQPSLSVEIGGTFILEVTGENSCHNRDTVVVTFHPYHNILFGDDDIIVCGSFVLDAGEGAYSYLWNTIPPQNTSSIIVNAPGNYSVTTTGDSFGCETTQSIYVDVREPISFSLGGDVSAPVDSFINIGIEHIYSEYLWNTGHELPILTVYGTNYGIGTFEFWLTAIALNGCSYTDTINVTFYHGSGIETNEHFNDIQLYPNPTSDLINLSSETNYINGIEIYNIYGELVLKEVINNMEISLNVSSFAKGLYLLKCKYNNDETKIFKLLIQ
ncbi:MAG TPA: immunoglobulin domain-containing protein [Bacteroidales bacterium]|nr:immunoglobulin domain-containing protein [Bacteroidales bacterium]